MNFLKPKTSNLKPRLGFTLFETIIYIALLSVVTSFVMVVFYQLIGSGDQHRNRIEADSEANFMMQRIVWAVTGASAINSPAINATGTSLSVTKFNYAQNPIVFDLNSRNLRIAKASGTPAFLGSSRIAVESVIFEHLPSVQSTPEGVKIILKVVSSDITRPQASTTLENIIYLR